MRPGRSPLSPPRSSSAPGACRPPPASPRTATCLRSRTRRWRPSPTAQRLVFVGALEAYKNVRGLAAAWRQIAAALPGAHLTIVGKGSQQAVVDELVRDLPGSVTHHRELSPPQVAAELDAARALVLPSWPEGLGRVVLESFARGRTVVATNAGGIPDIVTDGVDGILIPPGDTAALVGGMTRVLVDRAARRASRRSCPRDLRRVAPDGGRLRDVAIASSSTACSPARADEARLRHADARPGARLAGADARPRPCTRRTRRPLWSCSAGLSTGTRSPPTSRCGPSTHAARSAAPLAFERELAAALAWRRRRARAHGPDVSRARRASGARETGPAAPLVHALACEQVAAARNAARGRGAQRRHDRASRCRRRSCARSAMRSTSTCSSRRPLPEHDGPIRLLALGRTARWKGLGTLLDAFARLDGDVSLEIRGPSLTPTSVAHRAELVERARGRRPCVSVELRDPRAREVPSLLARCRRRRQPRRAARRRDARQGGLRGRRLRPTGRDDERGAGAVLRRAAARARRAAARSRRPVGGARPRSSRLSRRRARTIGAELRRRVVRDHSLDHWADAVIEVVREVRSARGG